MSTDDDGSVKDNTSLNCHETFFNNPENWKGTKGPALTIPEVIRNMQLKPILHIEFLCTQQRGDIVVGKFEPPHCNHAAFRLVFNEGLHIFDDTGGVSVYFGARISMDTADRVFPIECPDSVHSWFEGKVLGEDYLPGQLNVKLLKYSGTSHSAIQVTSYEMLQDFTLGGFVDFITSRKMHHFTFLLYGNGWKGCRDFILQVWKELVKADAINSTDINTGFPLAFYISWVYDFERDPQFRTVDCGKWISFRRSLETESVHPLW